MHFKVVILGKITFSNQVAKCQSAAAIESEWLEVTGLVPRDSPGVAQSCTFCLDDGKFTPGVKPPVRFCQLMCQCL